MLTGGAFDYRLEPAERAGRADRRDGRAAGCFPTARDRCHWPVRGLMNDLHRRCRLLDARNPRRTLFSAPVDGVLPDLRRHHLEPEVYALQNRSSACIDRPTRSGTLLQLLPDRKER